MRTRFETEEEYQERKEKTRWNSGLPETICGNGSKMENTETIRKFILEVIETHGITNIADVGCGDLNWIHDCIPPTVHYTGYDIKPRYADVKPLDVSREVLPFGHQLVICIYVLNHMYTDQAERSMRLLQECGAKYLLMSYSDHDEYEIVIGELITSIFHKKRERGPVVEGRQAAAVEWRYGLWEI